MPYGPPPDIGDFTGRDGAVAELAEALTPRGTVAIATVNGMVGVGKTVLAVRVAHAVRAWFPDGGLYADLRGTSRRPADPHAVLAGFLDALRARPDRRTGPEALDERAALFRSWLAGRRVLVVLDDARDPEQVRPLLPGTPGSAVLVTSRRTLAGMPGVRSLALDVLEPEEAVALLARVAGAERVAADRAAALDIVAACGFLPLAVRVAGARLAARPRLAASRLARRLARGGLDELRSAGLHFRPGDERLRRDEKWAFRLLARIDGMAFSTDAAAAALGVDRSYADELVESLTDHGLLETLAPGLYRYHDLMRQHALRRGRTFREDRAGRADRTRPTTPHRAAAR